MKFCIGIRGTYSNISARFYDKATFVSIDGIRHRSRYEEVISVIILYTHVCVDVRRGRG